MADAIFDSSDGDSMFEGFETHELGRNRHQHDEADDVDGFDMEVSDVSSVHTSDLSDFSPESDSENKDENMQPAGARPHENGWSRITTPIAVTAFIEQTGPNIDVRADDTPLFFSRTFRASNDSGTG